MDPEVVRAKAAQRVLVGDVIAGEDDGCGIRPLAKLRDGGVLALVPERVLDDVVPGPPPPVRRLGLHDGIDGAVRDLGICGVGTTRVHTEPEGLRLDPDALEMPGRSLGAGAPLSRLRA